MGNTKQTNIKIGGGGGFLFTLAILLMVSGFAMESMDYHPEFGALLFTIGFWLFMIPLIIVAVILIVIVVVAIVAR